MGVNMGPARGHNCSAGVAGLRAGRCGTGSPWFMVHSLPSAGQGHVVLGGAWSGACFPTGWTVSFSMPTPGRPAGATFTRDSLLDAAEEVALRDGLAALTLDAVAREAGASKGGLLHHFKGKHDLLLAMVARIAHGWSSDVRASIDAQPPGPHRTARAMLASCIDDPEAWGEACERTSAVLMAAMAHDRRLVQPVREAYAHVLEMIHKEAQSGPATGEVVVLALHGLWFEWAFGMADVTPARAARVRRTLRSMLQAPARARSAASRPRRSASKPPRSSIRPQSQKVRA